MPVGLPDVAEDVDLRLLACPSEVQTLPLGLAQGADTLGGLSRGQRLQRRVVLIQPKSGSYPVAGSPWGGFGGPMTGAMRSLM